MVERDQILEQVWDPHWFGPTKTLDVHVASLRKKLGDPGWIETVRGRLPAGGPMTRRLLLSYLSITAFVLLIIEVPLGVTARGEYDRLVAAVERDATVLATVVEDTLEAGGTGGLDPVAAGYQDRTGGRVVVVDRAGITVADSDPPAPGRRDLSTRPEIAAALRGEHATGSRSSATLGGAFLYVAVPVAQGRVYGAVRITYPTSTVDARVRRVWVALAGVAAVVLSVVVLVGFALARSTTRPMRALEQATTAVARGQLEAARPPTGGRRGAPARRRFQRHGGPVGPAAGHPAGVRGRRLPPAAHP